MNRAERTAYVWQNPASQIVTDRVEYELVFGLENLGMTREEMQRRLAEVVTFFGLEELLDRDTMMLSGGEMQTLNVAAAVAMNPDMLLLDEPTSQLDPVAAKRLYQLLEQIHEELGITIVMAEQRLEDVVGLADCMVIFHEGKCLAAETPQRIWEEVKETEFISFFPSYIQCYQEYSENEELLLSKKSVRKWFEESFTENVNTAVPTKVLMKEKITAKDLYFRYEKKGRDVLCGCCFEFPLEQIVCLSGGNGSGKSTLLEILSGRFTAYHGRIKKVPESRILLPQQPRYLFLEDSLDYYYQRDRDVAELAGYFDIHLLAERHPADLSGGELQRFALSYVLSREADLFLLDEPTKGMDPVNKKRLGTLLKKMTETGKTVIMVSHDMEFAAQYADCMALMFGGKTELVDETQKFFEENQFYTTGMNRVARGVSRHIITQGDVALYAKKIRH